MTTEAPQGQGGHDPLASIRHSFLSHLADRCPAIDAILERDDGRGITAEERDLIIHHTHKTAGIAASLGYEDLGRLAGDVESAWVHMPSGHVDVTPDPVLEVTRRFLDEIERVLDEDLVA